MRMIQPSKNVWEIKDKYKETLFLKWSIVKAVPGYSNITKKCLLCFHEELEIIDYPNHEELLKKSVKVDFKMSPCYQVPTFKLQE